jgi:hypothetical protein
LSFKREVTLKAPSQDDDVSRQSVEEVPRGGADKSKDSLFKETNAIQISV